MSKRKAAAISRIAQEVLDLATIETQNRDALDFHELGVWRIKAALEAAYDAGRESVQRKMWPLAYKATSK